MWTYVEMTESLLISHRIMYRLLILSDLCSIADVPFTITSFRCDPFGQSAGIQQGPGDFDSHSLLRWPLRHEFGVRFRHHPCVTLWRACLSVLHVYLCICDGQVRLKTLRSRTALTCILFTSQEQQRPLPGSHPTLMHSNTTAQFAAGRAHIRMQVH